MRLFGPAPNRSFEDISDALKRVVAHCGGSGLHFGAVRGGSTVTDDGVCPKGVAGFVSRAEQRELQEDEEVHQPRVHQRFGACRAPGENFGLFRELSQLSLEYDWAEIATATSDFAAERRLGCGAVGTVYRGTLEEGLDVAVKMFQEPSGTGFEEEVRLLSRCRHPNVVMLLGFAQCPTNQYCALVYELLPGGDAHARLQASKPAYVWQERLRTSIDVARGLAHLHKHRPEVFHRDIKTANILFGSDGVAKIADFGLACVSRRRGARELAVAVAAGTPGYADPHYAATGVVTEAAEIYSMGMVLVELLTGRPPAVVASNGQGIVWLDRELRLRDDRAKQRVLQRLDGRAGWPLATSSGLTTLVILCVHEDSGRRPSFLEVVGMLQDLLASAVAEATEFAASRSTAAPRTDSVGWSREASSHGESWSREPPLILAHPRRASVAPHVASQPPQVFESGCLQAPPYVHLWQQQQPQQQQLPNCQRPFLASPPVNWSVPVPARLPRPSHREAFAFDGQFYT